MSEPADKRSPCAETVPLLGSLCSGVGGLELAVSAALGARVMWQAEVDPDASSVLAERFGVPNLGDITAVDWTAVEPVEAMCFGFPCQDLSHAGKGAGIEEGTRSGLWFDCLRAVRMVRPGVVVVENVAALLTRRDGLDFTIVMSGLAEAGYDARWLCLRASDVGACHRRERVFIVATDAERVQRERWGAAGDVAGSASGAQGEGLQRERGGDATRDRRTAAPYADRGRLQERSEQDGWPGEPRLAASRRRDLDGRGAASADTDREQREGSRGTWGRWPESSDGSPGATAIDSTGVGRRAAGELGRMGTPERGEVTPADTDQPGSQGPEPARRRVVPAWGDYEPAVRRHAAAAGRDAPSPVDDRGRLNPLFVEWMMMLPAGWVTDLLGRSASLRVLGNAVVPLQAAEACRILLTADMVAA